MFSFYFSLFGFSFLEMITSCSSSFGGLKNSFRLSLKPDPRPGPENQDPKNQNPKNRDTKHRNPKNRNSKTRTHRTIFLNVSFSYFNIYNQGCHRKKLFENPGLSRSLFLVFQDIYFINSRTFPEFFKKYYIKERHFCWKNFCEKIFSRIYPWFTKINSAKFIKRSRVAEISSAK